MLWCICQIEFGSTDNLVEYSNVLTDQWLFELDDIRKMNEKNWAELQLPEKLKEKMKEFLENVDEALEEAQINQSTQKLH